MQYNITYREKDNGIQFIISYKDSQDKWKQKSKQGFKKMKEAKAAADVALDELKKNVDLNTAEDFVGITFGQFGKQYVEHTKKYRAVKTVESTQTALKKFSNLNDIELSKITPLHIQKIVDTMTEEGLNPNTIKYYLKKLTIVFNSAKNQFSIITNIPTRNIKLNKPKEIIKKALTESEINYLLENIPKRYYLLVYIAVNTGMRIGEILGLVWDDIDFKANTINITRQWKLNKSGTYDFGELKTTNSKRKIPISKNVSTEILKYKKVINLDTRVFDFKNKNSVIVNVNRALDNIGIGITIHELRHTYATKLVANGLDFKTVANIMGHTLEQTIKTYSHVNNDMLSKAHNLIEKIF